MIGTDRLHQLFHLGLQNSLEEKGHVARSELSQGCHPASFFFLSVLLLPSFYAGLTILQWTHPRQDELQTQL